MSAEHYEGQASSEIAEWLEECEQELKLAATLKSHEYNFDFETSTPFPVGRYNWEPFCFEDVPNKRAD